MAEAALPASLMAPALLREVRSAGGFATVLNKGSPHGGAMVVVHRHRGGVRAFELISTLSGRRWREAAAGDEAVDRFCAMQQDFDSDLWVIELDIDDIERFIVDLAEFD